MALARAWNRKNPYPFNALLADQVACLVLTRRKVFRGKNLVGALLCVLIDRQSVASPDRLRDRKSAQLGWTKWLGEQRACVMVARPGYAPGRIIIEIEGGKVVRLIFARSSEQHPVEPRSVFPI